MAVAPTGPYSSSPRAVRFKRPRCRAVSGGAFNVGTVELLLLIILALIALIVVMLLGVLSVLRDLAELVRFLIHGSDRRD